MNAIISVIKTTGELAISLAVMLILAVVALSAGEYIMAALFALALMVPVTVSFAVYAFRAARALRTTYAAA